MQEPEKRRPPVIILPRPKDEPTKPEDEYHWPFVEPKREENDD